MVPVRRDRNRRHRIRDHSPDHVPRIHGDQHPSRDAEPVPAVEDPAVEQHERDPGQRIAGRVEDVEGVVVQPEHVHGMRRQREVVVAETVVVAFHEEHQHGETGEDRGGDEGPVVGEEGDLLHFARPEAQADGGDDNADSGYAEGEEGAGVVVVGVGELVGDYFGWEGKRGWGRRGGGG